MTQVQEAAWIELQRYRLSDLQRVRKMREAQLVHLDMEISKVMQSLRLQVGAPQ